MKNLIVFALFVVAATGCAEFRTHSSFVAHVDNTNNLLDEADKTAEANNCYDAAGTNQERRNCVNKAVDELMGKQYYSFYKRSITVVNSLESDGKVALAEDGTEWDFVKR